VSAAERLLKVVLLVAFVSYVVSLILEDWRGATDSAILGLAAGVILIGRRLRELERRVRDLEGKARR